MSITILAIGDPHFKVNNQYETDIMHSAIVKVIKEKQPTSVVCLGDILDKFELIHVKVYNRVLSFLNDIAAESKDLNLIIGNHDRPNNNVFLTDEHPFNSLKRWDNITIIDKTIIKEIKNNENQTAKFVYVPYVDVGRFREAINTISLDIKMEGTEFDEKQWENTKSMAGFFAHNEFYGAKMGIVKSVKGDVWPTEAPFLVSGHIHDYDKLQTNLYYTGTPMQHGITDSKDKTISLFTYELINNEWKMVDEERIDLNIPKKLRLKLTKEELLEFKMSKNIGYLRIDIEIDPVEWKILCKNPKIVELLRNGVKIKPIDTRIRLKEGELNNVRIKIPYSERLIGNIRQYQEKEPEVVELFEELFGKISKEEEKEEIVIKIKKKKINF